MWPRVLRAEGMEGRRGGGYGSGTVPLPRPCRTLAADQADPQLPCARTSYLPPGLHAHAAKSPGPLKNRDLVTVCTWKSDDKQALMLNRCVRLSTLCSTSASSPLRLCSRQASTTRAAGDGHVLPLPRRRAGTLEHAGRPLGRVLMVC